MKGIPAYQAEKIFTEFVQLDEYKGRADRLKRPPHTVKKN